MNGNKRIATYIAHAFLYKNGYNFEPENGEIFSNAIDVAQGFKKYDEIKDWFIRRSKKDKETL